MTDGPYAPRPGAERNQTIDPSIHQLFGMAPRSHVVEDQPAIGMHGVNDFGNRAKTGDDNRNLVPNDDLQIRAQPRVGSVHDQVDRMGRGLGRVSQALLYLGQPGLERFAGALVRSQGAEGLSNRLGL